MGHPLGKELTMLAEPDFTLQLVTNGVARPAAAAADPAADATTDDGAGATGEAPDRHRLSQQQLAHLDEMEALLEDLGGADEPRRLIMLENKLTPALLAEDAALLARARETISERRLATAAEKAAVDRQTAAFYQVRSAVGAFRQVARTVILDEAGRIALGLDERSSHKMTAFAKAAADSLAVAQQEPYASALALVGYDEERMAGIMTLIATFNQQAAQRRAAQKAAKRATEVRDAAVRAVCVALHQLKVEVGALARRYPQFRTLAGASPRGS